MIRHPSENFLKFLMTSSSQGAGDDNWVKNTVYSLGFPMPDKAYVAWLRQDLFTRVPVNFQPQNRYHRDSVRFMRAEGIYALHQPDKGAREAAILVTNLRARPIVENLLLGRMDAKEIAKKTNQRLAEFHTAEGIEAYGRYYWNVSLLRVEDWAKLLEDYEIQRQQALSIVQGGAAMALHKMGFQQQIESKTMLKEMMEGLFFDFREWKNMPLSASKTKAITTIARTAAAVDEQLSQADSAMKESLKAFEQFRMKHAEQMVPDVRSIATAGNYTGSGARLLEAAPELEETKK
jgi:DNA/RNA-binding domain of Phe-tRNA-synthetase-like protein